MFDEEIMLFRLNGLWRVLRLKYFSEGKYEDTQDIHEMKDRDYDPDDFVDILRGIGYVPQGSLKGIAFDDIHNEHNKVEILNGKSQQRRKHNVT